MKSLTRPESYGILFTCPRQGKEEYIEHKEMRFYSKEPIYYTTPSHVRFYGKRDKRKIPMLRYWFCKWWENKTMSMDEWLDKFEKLIGYPHEHEMVQDILSEADLWDMYLQGMSPKEAAKEFKEAQIP